MRPASLLWPSAFRLLPPLVTGETSRYLYPAVGRCFPGNSVTTDKRKDKIHLTSGVRLSLRQNCSNQCPEGLAMRNDLRGAGMSTLSMSEPVGAIPVPMMMTMMIIIINVQLNTYFFRKEII